MTSKHKKIVLSMQNQTGKLVKWSYRQRLVLKRFLTRWKLGLWLQGGIMQVTAIKSLDDLSEVTCIIPPWRQKTSFHFVKKRFRTLPVTSFYQFTSLAIHWILCFSCVLKSRITSFFPSSLRQRWFKTHKIKIWYKINLRYRYHTANHK